MLVNCDSLTNDINRLKNFCDHSKFNAKNNELKIEQTHLKSTTKDLQIRVKLKIILNSPNLILDALNENDVLSAAVLFRRAKYLCNQFTDEEQQSFSPLIDHKIFLDKLFDLIYQKYLEITNYIDYNLNDHQLFRTLFAICLIKEEPFELIFLEFLANRKVQCFELFKNQANVDKLLNFFKIIFNTLEIAFNLYNSTDELSVPSIADQIKSIVINYEFLSRNEENLIDQLFVDFRIEQFIRSNDNLVEKIEQGIENWFEEIRTNSIDFIRTYLQSTYIDNLYESFDRVNEYFNKDETLILKSHYYEVICKKRIDFWDYFLSIPFDDAWRYFLSNTIIRLFTNLKNKIQYLNEEEETVLNISEYIWSNDLNDLNEMHKKYCGTTERIIELINQTNEEFDYLLDKFLISNKRTNKDIVLISNQKFKNYFYTTFREQNGEFLVYVDNLIKSNLKREQNFNLAHLIRMLVLICPNYKQCFDILNLKSWFQTKEFLLNLSYTGYNSYINQIIEDLVQLFYEEQDRNQALNCLHTSANWLEIEIKESIDDGKEVSTKIYIPKQISLPLENLLISLTIRLCRLSGHTLPNKLKLMILDELTRSLCTGYQKIYDSMQNKSIKTSLKSTETLQIYYDLVFLKSLLYHSINDENLRTDLQNILNQFQQNIDPFDLHLFSSYIQTNIELNKSNLAMILNYLLPYHQFVKQSTNLYTKEERNFKLKFNLL